MKRFNWLIFIFVLSGCQAGRGQSLILADNGKSPYDIVIVPDNNPNVQKGAQELQKYFGQVTGVMLPVQKANTAGSHQIWIVTQQQLEKIYPGRKTKDLGDDGLTIFTNGTNVVITGGDGKGPLYGVYTFLENYLGCRMYSSNTLLIPKKSNVILPQVNLTEVPALVFRDVFYQPAFSAQYADWHKLTPARTSYSSSWGTWSHSSFQLVPPAKYFGSHPEYYSLINNKRAPDQLDYSDSGAYNTVLNALRIQIKNQPGYRYWSVGQEDNSLYCQCALCQATYQKTGSPAGTMVAFANKLAKEFPTKTISILAYNYSRKPPVNIGLEPNLNVMFCADIRNYVTDYSAAADNRPMRDAFNGWKKLTPNIFVWDYIINFNALESVYPNLLQLKPNLDYFVKNGAKGYFAQGDYYPGGEFAELRTYLMAKLLWNPEADDKSIIQDFLQGYYGTGAAPYLWQYIQLIDQQLTGAPDKLSEEEANQYYRLFQQAEKASAGQTIFLQRINKEQMGLDYSVIQMYLQEAKKDPKAFFQNDGKYKAFNATTDRFLKELEQNKTQRLIHAEHNIPLFQYITNWRKEMSNLQKKSGDTQ